MIQRYTHPEMGAIWSEQRRYETWLEVELAATDAMADAGLVPAEAARELRARAAFDIARIEEIEQTTQHDVIAFTTAVAEKVGPAARWLHFGLTSSDVVDTAQALQMREACGLIVKGIAGLMEAVRVRAEEHRRTAMIGRTHGVHAEPMTFGVKLALWYAELQRDLDRVLRARDVVSVGKLSGAVGTFAHLDPGDRGRRLRAPRARTRAGRVASHPARPPRRADDGARHHRRLAREVRARDSWPAEDRDRRGRGAVRQGPEGLLGDAAQAQSDRLRADHRPRAPDSRQRHGRAREHRALARTRHLAFVGRARHPSRQLHRPRSHAAPLHAHRPRHGRLRGPHAREPRRARAASCFRAPCCSSSPSAACRASRPTSGCSGTPCARSTSSRTSRRCCSPIRI